MEGLVSSYDWAYLQALRTLREPRQPMPRLLDLLAYLAEPGPAGSVWLFLDIKIDDPPEELVGRIAETIAGAPAGGWRQRIVLGCWTARHLGLCRRALPGFALAHTGFSVALAREYLAVPGVAINMRQEPLVAVGGAPFRARCRGEGRPVYAWTVNEEPWMEWCIENGADCVITDDPRRYLEVCRRRQEKRRRAGGREGGVWAVARAARQLVLPVYYSLVMVVLLWYLRVPQRFGRPREVREELRKF